MIELLRLRELREYRGLSQVQVSEKLGVSRQSYNFYENGKRDPNTEILKNMADFFEVSLDCLVGHETKEYKNDFQTMFPNDENITELISLYKNLSLRSRIKLIGAAYAILSEQNINSKPYVSTVINQE